MPPLTFTKAINLLESGKIDFERIVTSSFPLEELEMAFYDFEKKKDMVLKMLINPQL